MVPASAPWIAAGCWPTAVWPSAPPWRSSRPRGVGLPFRGVRRRARLRLLFLRPRSPSTRTARSWPIDARPVRWQRPRPPLGRLGPRDAPGTPIPAKALAALPSLPASRRYPRTEGPARGPLRKRPRPVRAARFRDRWLTGNPVGNTSTACTTPTPLRGPDRERISSGPTCPAVRDRRRDLLWLALPWFVPLALASAAANATGSMALVRGRRPRSDRPGPGSRSADAPGCRRDRRNRLPPRNGTGADRARALHALTCLPVPPRACCWGLMIRPAGPALVGGSGAPVRPAGRSALGLLSDPHFLVEAALHALRYLGPWGERAGLSRKPWSARPKGSRGCWRRRSQPYVYIKRRMHMAHAAWGKHPVIPRSPVQQSSNSQSIFLADCDWRTPVAGSP